MPNNKNWIIALNEYSIGKLKTIVVNKNFEVDDEFKKYINDYESILNNISDHAPMLSINNGVPYIKNKCNYTPELKSQDMLSALFEARSLGILLWDEEYDQFLNSKNVSPIVSSFLKRSPGLPFNLDFQKTPLIEIKDIVKYLDKILIVMTNQSLLKNFEMSYKFLTDIGFKNSEISVMFRMSNNNNPNRQFNKLVKDYSLNNPISDTTKIVFVNEKITKPILKSEIHFGCSIVLGSSHYLQHNVHNYVKSQENYICYGDQRSNKDLSFVNV